MNKTRVETIPKDRFPHERNFQQRIRQRLKCLCPGRSEFASVKRES